MSIETWLASGEWSRLRFGGADPVGILVYDALGNMAVQITTNPRNAEIVRPPEWVNGYVAYYARYEVDVAAGIVTHYRRNHVNPAIGGLLVVRHFEFHDDILTLTAAPGRTVRLSWSRAR